MFGVTYRHPAVVAKMAATIDHISGGRMEFGVGAAWNEDEHGEYGIPFPRIGVRMDMLDEACQSCARSGPSRAPTSRASTTR